MNADLARSLVAEALIYAVGHISGAHFNPAVTLAFATSGGRLSVLRAGPVEEPA